MATTARRAACIALLGGESSGKSTLSIELTQALQAHGLRVARVPEHLRAWCEATGRAPLAREQAAIAAEQDRQIEQAAHSGAEVVVADTTSLVVAAYSAHYFDDAGLWPDALDRQRCIDLTLLMGLDLPWEPDGLFRDSPAVRDAIDRRLRGALQGAGLPFTPVYGRGPHRLTQALRAVQNRLGDVLGERLARPLVASDAVLEQGSGRWSCDNCSDPECEHRLFSSLVRQRGGSLSGSGG